MTRVRVVLKFFDVPNYQRTNDHKEVILGGATAVCFFFDVNDVSSLKELDKWFDLLVKGHDPNLKLIFLVANKIDLTPEFDQESIEQKVKEWKKQLDVNYHVLKNTSTITNSQYAPDKTSQFIMKKLATKYIPEKKDTEIELMFKLVVLGELGVGKTSFLRVCVGKPLRLQKDAAPAIGPDFFVKSATFSYQELKDLL